MNLQPELFVDLDFEETCLNRATIIRNQNPLAEVVFGKDAVVNTHIGIIVVLIPSSFCKY